MGCTTVVGKQNSLVVMPGHGVEREMLGEDHGAELLNQWLNTLYGKGTSDRLDITGQCRQKGQRYIQANLPYYTEANAPHQT